MSPLVETYQSLCKQGQRVGAKPYLVLDGAWQEELIGKIRGHDEGWEPLMGTPAESKHDAHMRSPLLVDLRMHSFALDEWIVGDFLEKIGIVVFSKAKIDELRRSLKRFLHVATPKNTEPVYFRFFDARTLYCFLHYGYPDQWQDFFRDVSLIAAPYDYSAGWAVYQMDGEVLRFGVEKQGGRGWKWHTHENKNRAVKHYRASFPFRTIDERQYTDMMRCAELSFCHEIYDFLKRAFPSETRGIKKKELIKFIDECQRTAAECGFQGEDCVFYWTIIASIYGEKFHMGKYAHRYLNIPWFSREKRLRDILARMNHEIGSAHIAQLLAGRR